jgi:hypothetical protein
MGVMAVPEVTTWALVPEAELRDIELLGLTVIVIYFLQEIPLAFTSTQY